MLCVCVFLCTKKAIRFRGLAGEQAGGQARRREKQKQATRLSFSKELLRRGQDPGLPLFAFVPGFSFGHRFSKLFIREIEMRKKGFKVFIGSHLGFHRHLLVPITLKMISPCRLRYMGQVTK